ncbi:hypothetical protein ElyMa_005355000 [Elysia marginata]|uniref:Uncharacterized protein n=1 Tax=Elysia marginata TaxID=1093978 RepID=A0AAV4EB38_9GAST|nr:hypothetical protein ElyMa_005355000 [Elysia marginata]
MAQYPPPLRSVPSHNQGRPTASKTLGTIVMPCVWPADFTAAKIVFCSLIEAPLCYLYFDFPFSLTPKYLGSSTGFYNNDCDDDVDDDDDHHHDDDVDDADDDDDDDDDCDGNDDNGDNNGGDDDDDNDHDDDDDDDDDDDVDDDNDVDHDNDDDHHHKDNHRDNGRSGSGSGGNTDDVYKYKFDGNDLL